MNRHVISKLRRLPDGVMKEEIILSERSSPRSMSYDPWQRNLYVTELFGDFKDSHRRGIGGSRDERDVGQTNSENFWSSIMVGAQACH